MEGNSELTVDLQAITHNVGVLRSLCRPEVRFCAVLKADGYGLGAEHVAPAIAAAGGSMLAVFSVEEAMALLDQDLPILILMPVHAKHVPDRLMESIRSGSLHFVVHEANQMKSMAALGNRLGVRIPVHLKADTGLHRGGCEPRDAIVLARAIDRSTDLDLAGLMTHFANAASSESATANQMRQIRSVHDLICEDCTAAPVVHASGTCGVLRGADYHGDMIRVGLGWSGYLTPSATELVSRLPVPLRPAVTWRSRIVLVRTIAAGDTVGYGGRWCAERTSRVGVIPVGYADGYPQDGGHPADGGPGLAVGVMPRLGMDPIDAPIIGRVSMDQVLVDLTDAQGVDVGSPVELISASPGSACGLDNLARRLQRPPHAILVQIHARVPRIHSDSVSLKSSNGGIDGMPSLAQASAVAG